MEETAGGGERFCFFVGGVYKKGKKQVLLKKEME